MKNQNYNSANLMLQNSLMWIKRSGYKPKSIAGACTIQHPDLSWIKINGYHHQNTSSAQIQMMMTAYEKIQLVKAQYTFYSVAMATALLGLILITSVF